MAENREIETRSRAELATGQRLSGACIYAGIGLLYRWFAVGGARWSTLALYGVVRAYACGYSEITVKENARDC